MGRKFLFIILVCLVCPIWVLTLNAQVYKFKKPKKDKAFALIKSQSNYWQYFTQVEEGNVYRFKMGEPITNQQKTKQEQHLYQKRLESALLKQKSKKTGLSPEFLETKEETNLKNVEKSDIEKSIQRLKKRKGIKIAKTTAPIKKKKGNSLPVVGPYSEGQEPPPDMQETEESAEYKKGQSDFYLE